MKKRSKFSDKISSLLRRAYRAKDSSEFEEIAEEAKDAFPDDITDEDFPTKPNGEEDIHIHVDQDDEEFPSGRATFTDDDIQAYIDQNDAEHRDIFSRLEALERQLSGAASEDEEFMVGDNTAMEEAMLDELPEELQTEAGKARDSRYLGDTYRETISMAEVLAPGIKYGTFDSAANPVQTFKRICGLRRKALDQAYADPSTSGILNDLLVGKKLDTRRMTCDAVRVLFRGAYAAKRNANNSVTRDSAPVFGNHPVQKKGITSLAELNKLNAERYS